MTRLLTALLGAAVLAGSAAAAGPWPGLAQSVTGPSGVSYQAVARGGFTTVTAMKSGGAVVASARFRGAYGIPAVTTNGEAGGLSPSGKLLVLAPPPDYGRLRTQSRFVLLSTPSLTRARTIVLRGEFGFDAISPNGRWLYVLQRVAANDLVRYVVRVYDLRTNFCCPGGSPTRDSRPTTMRGHADLARDLAAR